MKYRIFLCLSGAFLPVKALYWPIRGLNGTQKVLPLDGK